MKTSDLIAAYNLEKFVAVSKQCGAHLYVASDDGKVSLTTIKAEAHRWDSLDSVNKRVEYYSNICGMKFSPQSLKDTVLALEHEDDMNGNGFYNVRCLDYEGKTVTIITEKDSDIMQVAGLSVENPSDIFEYVNHLEGGRFLTCLTLTKF